MESIISGHKRTVFLVSQLPGCSPCSSPPSQLHFQTRCSCCRSLLPARFPPFCLRLAYIIRIFLPTPRSLPLLLIVSHYHSLPFCWGREAFSSQTSQQPSEDSGGSPGGQVLLRPSQMSAFAPPSLLLLGKNLSYPFASCNFPSINPSAVAAMPDDGDDPLLHKVRSRTRGGGGKDNVFLWFVFFFPALHICHNLLSF